MYRENLPEMPARVRRLAVDKRGYPIPWFVDYVNGEPDFRIADGRKLVKAVQDSLCWTCGQSLGAYKTFLIGPMCVVNKVSAEPPSHKDCAIFAAKACPFLIMPKAVRREAGLPPKEERQVAGFMIERNPGVTVAWTTKSYSIMTVSNGWLFRLHTPENLLWFAEGRSATRKEIMHSIESGLPLLQAAAEKDGPNGLLELAQAVAAALPLIPQEPQEHRHCSICEGNDHHWLEDCDKESGEPVYVCKHCSVTKNYESEDKAHA